MHVQSVQKYCFLLSNMQICGVFVALVVVVALAPTVFAKLKFERKANPGGKIIVIQWKELSSGVRRRGSKVTENKIFIFS